MRLTWDSAKRAKTLAERGLDFADAAAVFAGVTVEVEDIPQGLWRDSYHLLWPPRRTHGGSRLRPERQQSTHFQHEEG
jgi:hypothetical protein